MFRRQRRRSLLDCQNGASLAAKTTVTTFFLHFHSVTFSVSEVSLLMRSKHPALFCTINYPSSRRHSNTPTQARAPVSRRPCSAPGSDRSHGINGQNGECTT